MAYSVYRDNFAVRRAIRPSASSRAALPRQTLTWLVHRARLVAPPPTGFSPTRHQHVT